MRQTGPAELGGAPALSVAAGSRNGGRVPDTPGQATGAAARGLPDRVPGTLTKWAHRLAE